MCVGVVTCGIELVSHRMECTHIGSELIRQRPEHAHVSTELVNSNAQKGRLDGNVLGGPIGNQSLLAFLSIFSFLYKAIYSLNKTNKR